MVERPVARARQGMPRGPGGQAAISGARTRWTCPFFAATRGHMGTMSSPGPGRRACPVAVPHAQRDSPDPASPRTAAHPVNPLFPPPPPAQPRAASQPPHGGGVRIAIVAESFLPLMNGVTHSILRVLEHLQERGDEVLVIAPSTQDTEAPDEVYGAHVHRLPSVPLAGYANVRVAMGGVYSGQANPCRVCTGRGPPGVAVRARLARGAGRPPAGDPHHRHLPDRGPGLRRAVRCPLPGELGLEPGGEHPPAGIPDPRPLQLRAQPAPRPRHSAGRDVAARRGHAAVLPGQARRRMAGHRRPGRRAHHRLRGPARGRKAGAGPRRAGRCPRHPAGDCGRRTRSGRPSRTPCRTRSSPGSSAARSWPARWRPSISSCTPASSRPSARPSRRRWPRACRWSPRAAAARWTSSRTPAPAGCTSRATWPRCGPAWWT